MILRFYVGLGVGRYEYEWNSNETGNKIYIDL